MKRSLVTLGIVLVVAGITAAFLFLRSPAPTTPPPTVTPPTGSPTILPKPDTTPQLRALTSHETFTYWFDADEKGYGLGTDGIIRSLETDTEISKQKLTDVRSAAASSDGGRLLVGFGTPVTLSIFSTSEQLWTPLAVGATTGAFHPTNADVLAYLTETGSGSRIEQLSLANGKTTILSTLNVTDVELFWPQSGKIHLLEKPSAAYAGSLWSLSIAQGTIQTTMIAPGLSLTWSKDGLRALRYTAGNPGELTLIDGSGTLVATVPFTTLPSKCAFTADANVILCAVPNELPTNAVLPDSYLTRSVKTTDRIVRWNVETGVTSPLLDTSAIDADQLTAMNGDLYFINRYDQIVYAMGVGGE